MKTEARIYFPLPCDPIFQKHSLPAIFALSILELENSSPSQARHLCAQHWRTGV
jgi:hypothetical protein